MEKLRNLDLTRAERVFLILTALFIGALVLTNAIAGKFFVLFGQELSAGIIPYPLTFLITDLISEIYGKKKASRVVIAGFVVSVFVTIIIILASLAPAWEHSPVSQQSFNSVFGLMPGIVFGSMCAYLAAQYLDVRIFEFWRNLTRGRHLWLRNNGSTILSQLVDTVMVVTIALVLWPNIDGNPHTQAIPMDSWWGIIVGQYLFKALIALLDTPFFYLLNSMLQKYISNEPALADPVKSAG